MTLAIAHKTTTPDERVIVDAVREVRPPFSPSAVVDDFAALLKSYRVSKVIGDHYGGEFVKEPFRKHCKPLLMESCPEGAHNTRERLLRSRQGLLSATGVARSQGRKAPWGHTLHP
jgi:hypothetical protein